MTDNSKENWENQFDLIFGMFMWIASYIVGWAVYGIYLVVTFMVAPYSIYYIPQWINFALLIGIPAIIHSIIQQEILKRQLNISIQSWFLISTLATILAVFCVSIILPFFYKVFPQDSIYDAVIILVPVYGIPAILQAWLLRNSFAYTWVWPLAAIASAIICGSLLWNIAGDSEWEFLGILFYGSILQGIVMAFALVMLLNITKAQSLKNSL